MQSHHRGLTIFNLSIIGLLLLVIIEVGPAAAVTYKLEVFEPPPVGTNLLISGLFDAAPGVTTFNENNISNWTFTGDASLFANNQPVTFAQTFGDTLASFIGDTTTVTKLNVAKPIMQQGSLNFDNTGSDCCVALFIDAVDTSGTFKGITNNQAPAVSIVTVAIPAAIPEPATFLLFGSGLSALVAWRWKNGKGRTV